MAELKPVASIEEEIEKVIARLGTWPAVGEIEMHAFEVLNGKTHDYKQIHLRELVRSLIPIVRREAMRECAEIALSKRYSEEITEYKRRYNAGCTDVASAIEQRMEGQ